LGAPTQRRRALNSQQLSPVEEVVQPDGEHIQILANAVDVAERNESDVTASKEDVTVFAGDRDMIGERQFEADAGGRTPAD
jgi:hypothetical protein